MFLKQNKKCALTGLDIWFGISTKEKTHGKKEQTASLDRIDSSKGYTKDNVLEHTKVCKEKIKHDELEIDFYWDDPIR